MALITRGIDPVLLAEFTRREGFHPVAIVESVWPDGTVRIHSGNGPMSWDSKTWLGIGRVAGFSVDVEGGGAVPSGARMDVRGTLADILSYTDPAARNGLVQVWIGALTEPGGTTLIGTPFSPFTGYLDSNEMRHDFESGDAYLSVIAGAGPAAREHAAMYHSPEDQKARHPGDTLLERVAVSAKWRSSPMQFPNPG